MQTSEKKANRWTTCNQCKGRGKLIRRIQKKVKLNYQIACLEFEKSGGKGNAPIPPKGNSYSCPHCDAKGIVIASGFPISDSDNYPHVAIVGGGIGGTALAVACLHRGIPFTLYERDLSFDERSQGYGLTLQQASRVIQALGITSLDAGIVSTRHVVHTPEGEIVGQWGIRKWLPNNTASSPKKTNIHIARQALRLALLEQLGGSEHVKWGQQLLHFEKNKDEKYDLHFLVNGEEKKETADLIVGADGIRSRVRDHFFQENAFPLRYLGCIVILGICPLSKLTQLKSPLLDSATVFQTANGQERIYVMPFSKDSVMWQLSFLLDEDSAKTLSATGTAALKAEAIERTKWHSPIPEIVAGTDESLISGYPVYDRALFEPTQLANAGDVTLIGDAAHPMSPFKGQGANQALLDALSLARKIAHGCRPKSNWRSEGLRTVVLNDFESEMLERSASKVEDSAAAALFLHSDIALYAGDEPRGRVLKRQESKGLDQ